ncbi:radical SAM protein [Streptomyces cyaneogriseus]|uniref:radical SAM protein n=1 Tax=Streptomyces cyaneogriseus TaxID=68192 RepID=UPI003D18AE69
MLIDTYGRVATDLRVSLTDRCNLRCTYCMPEEGLQWLAKPDLLTDDEIVRLIGIAVTTLGVTEVRFTGGEPLLRPGLVGIVERVAALDPRPRTSLTTNGIGLKRTAAALKAAGLDRVNVSLDTLRPDVFNRITSYNVCYTKLLRFALPAVLGVQRHLLDEAVITSYSIHYTKLYDWWASSSASPPATRAPGRPSPPTASAASARRRP